MFSFVPVKRLSSAVTSYPSARSLLQRWLPRNPAPPVTSAAAEEPRPARYQCLFHFVRPCPFQTDIIP